MYRPEHAQICLAVDISKATQQGAAPEQRGCQLGCTRRGCTLVTPGELNRQCAALCTRAQK